MGIVSVGSYLPDRRLDRAVISAALGVPAGSGTRTVASYDEDATTMGVEAARRALAAASTSPARILFATASPPYLEKTNAAALHAALGLDESVAAYDVIGSPRSGLGALRMAAEAAEPTLVICSDVRTGRPGGADERDGGDGAAAVLFAPDGPDDHARVVGWAASTLEVLDRWRLPEEPVAHVWEERFGEHALVPSAQRAFADVCKATDTTPDAFAHVVVTGVHARAARAVARSLGARPDALVDDLLATVGNTGTAHPMLLLVQALERAGRGDRIAVVVIGDGADAFVVEATSEQPAGSARPTLADQLGSGRTLSYETFLTWRGMLEREPPRRPDPTAPAAPPSLRHDPWKFAFTGSRCEACGERHLPPARVCARCGAIDQMRPVPMSDVPARIATFTVDRLAFTPSPPLVAAVLDFEGGGRFRCELTDVDPDAVAIGDPVEMTFRRVATAHSVHNYFWKGRPVRTATPGGEV